MTKIFEVILIAPTICGMVVIVALFAAILACTVDMIAGAIAAIARGKVLHLGNYEGMFMPYTFLKKILRVNNWLGVMGRLWLLYGAAIVVTGIITIATGLLDKSLFK